MFSRSLPLMFTLACGSATVQPAPPTAAVVQSQEAALALPKDSLYALHPKLVDQHGNTTSLDVHRGHPVILSMFYASCPSACPMLIHDVQMLEERLPPEVRADLRVVLVSLDPERDTPAELADVVKRHELDDARWTLLRPEADAVREISAALGIRYRPTTNGEMNHSSLLTLLDIHGRPVARLEGLQRDPKPLTDALQEARHPTAPTQ